MDMTDEEFEATVQEALDEMPEQFVDAMHNIVFMIQDEPDEDQLQSLDDEPDLGVNQNGELLGLFEGYSLEERSMEFDGDLPDMVFLFKGPHERCFATHDEMVKQIKKTVIHEIGHYFGLDDDKLHAMGY